MLFNSFEFIFLFLPITIVVFYCFLNQEWKKTAVIWLVIASLFFYAWWNPPYLALLLISIGFNYSTSRALCYVQKEEQVWQGTALLWIGIIFNLLTIGYYKYFNFFLDSVNQLFGDSSVSLPIILPLGISFYTFQQIAYLIDSHEGETQEDEFRDYCLFVAFFPQLIAGPIVTHQEMIPQFSDLSKNSRLMKNLTIGITIFAFGLFKKTVLADQISIYASPVFDAANQGVNLTPFEAWGGALAYTLQIYFDFSGYTDMAIGAARMFGFRLPTNFNSPYQAINIIDFWGRWHLTLTRFLTRYLYNPIALVMSRRRLSQGKSLIKRGLGSPGAFLELVAFPTLTTMFLAGLWHGAGWQYIVFGLLHGFYLTVNHAWHMLRKLMGHDLKKNSWMGRRMSHAVTFLSVVVAMVFFRAPNVSTGISVLTSMINVNGLTGGEYFVNFVFGNPKIGAGDPKFGIVFVLVLLLITFLLPNTQEWISNYEPALGFDADRFHKKQPKWKMNALKKFCWQPTILWGALTSGMLVMGLLALSGVSEFIYFQF